MDVLPATEGHWAGCVIPKRHARRSVTRSLLKRQIRAALARHAQALPQGLWLVRLKAPFVPAQFPSAASDAPPKKIGGDSTGEWRVVAASTR